VVLHALEHRRIDEIKCIAGGAIHLVVGVVKFEATVSLN
jgi:hypothetical protein